jgi:hypothetical protein
MAARKNKAPKTTTDEARAFVVVLEEIRAQNRGFGEGLQLLREHQHVLDQQQQTMLREQQTMRQEQQTLRQEMVARFDHVERDIAEIRHDVGLVKIAVLDHARELKEIRVGLEKKVDRDEVEPIVQRVIARSR